MASYTDNISTLLDSDKLVTVLSLSLSVGCSYACAVEAMNYFRNLVPSCHCHYKISGFRENIFVSQVVPEKDKESIVNEFRNPSIAIYSIQKSLSSDDSLLSHICKLDSSSFLTHLSSKKSSDLLHGPFLDIVSNEVSFSVSGYAYHRPASSSSSLPSKVPAINSQLKAPPKHSKAVSSAVSSYFNSSKSERSSKEVDPPITSQNTQVIDSNTNSNNDVDDDEEANWDDVFTRSTNSNPSDMKTISNSSSVPSSASTYFEKNESLSELPKKRPYPSEDGSEDESVQGPTKQSRKKAKKPMGLETLDSNMDEPDDSQVKKTHRTPKKPVVVLHGAMDDFVADHEETGSDSLTPKKKKKILKSKTYVDDKGYLVSEDYYEEVTDDEQESMVHLSSMTAVSSKSLVSSKADPPPSNSSTTSSKTASKKAASSGQKSMLSFFSKK